MDALLADLLPLILGAILAPVYPIIVVLLLQSERGLVKATGFVAGAVTARLLQGVLFAPVLAPAVEAESDASLKLIGLTLLTVTGVLLLVMGVKKWRKENTDGDGDELPKWMSAITEVSVRRAFGGGALLIVLSVKQWVFTLSAIALIEEALPDMAARASLYLFYTLATQVLVLPPILAFAVAPEKSSAPLYAAQGWLQGQNRVIEIVVSLLFGVFFSYRGITGLLALRGM